MPATRRNGARKGAIEDSWRGIADEFQDEADGLSLRAAGAVKGTATATTTTTTTIATATTTKKSKQTKKKKRKHADYEQDGEFLFSRAAPKRPRSSLEGQDEEGGVEVSAAARRPAKKTATEGKASTATSIPKGHARGADSGLPGRSAAANGRTARPRQQPAGSSRTPSPEPGPQHEPRRKRPPAHAPSHPLPPPSQQHHQEPQAAPPSRIPQRHPHPQPPDHAYHPAHARPPTHPAPPRGRPPSHHDDPTPQAQKIALPFADTPVMRKNKEMRAKNSKKPGGQRRSSLGMRGRRASSLIDSGVSNALPHGEVRTEDFYKHIEGEGLPEPRRMRQLLTWCATRAMAHKPAARTSQEQSALLVARIIQDEILKEFSVRSELSDWFSRDEHAMATSGGHADATGVVRKPNPKNEQNSAKIRELEAQIERLRREQESLRALLQPPAVPEVQLSDAEDGEASDGGEDGEHDRDGSTEPAAPSNSTARARPAPPPPSLTH
ncbi:hypothetical protein KEM52_002427, partial [Ascosphaera acerosa]